MALLGFKLVSFSCGGGVSVLRRGGLPLWEPRKIWFML